MLLFSLACAWCACAGQQASPGAAGPNQVPCLRVTEPGVAVEIPDRRYVVYLGRRLPLFQENMSCYIVKISTPEYGETLCAFPKRNNIGGGTGWVTAEKFLIVGEETLSTAGVFYLQQGERIRITRETDNHYAGLVERYGQQAPITIPKVTPGLVFELVDQPKTEEPVPEETPGATPEPGPVPPTARKPNGHLKMPPSALAPQADKPAATRPLGKRVTSVHGQDLGLPPGSSVTRVTIQEEAPAPATVPPPPVQPPPAEEVLPVPAASPETPPVPAEPAAVDQPPDTAEEPAQPEPEPERPRQSSRAVDFLMSHSLTLIILLIAVAIEAVLIARLHKTTAKLKTSSEEVQTYTTLGESTASDYLQNLSHESGDFSGSFKGFSIIELLQFLHSAQETGILVVKDDARNTLGEFYFDRGEMIDAHYKGKQAEAAVHALFRGANDSFNFNRRPSIDRQPKIKQQTMGLLLEVSKQLDEERGG